MNARIKNKDEGLEKDTATETDSVSAFDCMWMYWICKVLRRKAPSRLLISILKNLYTRLTKHVMNHQNQFSGKDGE